MFRLETLAEKGWGPMISPLIVSMLTGTGTLDVPSGDSCKEGLGPNGEPSLWSMLAGTGTLYVPSGDSS
jgi:hypothetical protein